MNSISSFLIITLLALVKLRVEGTDCTFVTPSDREKSLLELLNPIKGKRSQATYKPDKDTSYTYELGICTDVKPEYPGVGMLQIESSTKSHIVGRYNSTQIKGGDNWILLTYKHGDPYGHHCNQSSSRDRQAEIMIICDPNVELGELKILEENTDMMEECYYLFEISSSAVCLPPKPEGLGAGSIFCILVFVFLGVYLIIGFLYQRIVVGAKGMEQIPNFTFWKNFGALQADGCNFLCRCGERQEMKMYRGINEQLLSPERRDEPDDRLLPM